MSKLAYLQDPNPLASERTPEVVFNNAFPGRDMEEEHVIKAPGSFGLYPLSEKKNRFRPCIIVLRNCLCELHKSTKDVNMCRPAKHLIDLRLVFNVCIIKETIEVKDTCLCVMTPTETYYMAVDKEQTELESFYEEFLQRSRKARSDLLMRPVFKDEYFEASWDVLVCTKPKLRKNYTQAEVFEDLLDKHRELEGRRRLCVRNASLVFFKMEIQPSRDSEAPYSRECFFDFPINVISRYGKQERYFFLQIGRCAEYGQGEIWMVCENGSTAKYMHERIDEINQRESDRRKEKGIKLTFPGISQRVMKSRAHRERAHTHHEADLEAQRAAFRKQQEKQQQKNETLAEEAEGAADGKENSIAEEVAEEPRRADEAAGDKKKDEKKKGGLFGSKKPKDAKERDEKAGTPPKRSGLAGLFRFAKLGGGDKSADAKSKTTAAASTPAPAVRRPVAENPDYHPHEPPYPVNFTRHQPEDYVAYDHKKDSRKSSAQPSTHRQISVQSNREARRVVPVPKDYVQMETTPEKPEKTQKYVFPLQEVRSYVYDSNDSCNSPMARSATNSTASTSYAQPAHDHQSADASYTFFTANSPLDEHEHKRQHSGETSSMRPSTSGLQASGGRTYSLGSRPAGRGMDLRMAASTAAATAAASASGSLNTVGSIAEEEAGEMEAEKSQSAREPRTKHTTFARAAESPSGGGGGGQASNRSTPEITVTRDGDERRQAKEADERRSEKEDAGRKESEDAEERARELGDRPTELIEIRGRTHSLGSRSWIKGATQKLVGGHKRHKDAPPTATHSHVTAVATTSPRTPAVAAAVAASAPPSTAASEHSVLEGRGRADSQSSANSQCYVNARRNTNRSLASSGPPIEDDDLMEIDFEAKSKTDSPLSKPQLVARHPNARADAHGVGQGAQQTQELRRGGEREGLRPCLYRERDGASTVHDVPRLAERLRARNERRRPRDRRIVPAPEAQVGARRRNPTLSRRRRVGAAAEVDAHERQSTESRRREGDARGRPTSSPSPHEGRTDDDQRAGREHQRLRGNRPQTGGGRSKSNSRPIDVARTGPLVVAEGAPLHRRRREPLDRRSGRRRRATGKTAAPTAEARLRIARTPGPRRDAPQEGLHRLVGALRARRGDGRRVRRAAARLPHGPKPHLSTHVEVDRQPRGRRSTSKSSGDGRRSARRRGARGGRPAQTFRSIVIVRPSFSAPTAVLSASNARSTLVLRFSSNKQPIDWFRSVCSFVFPSFRLQLTSSTHPLLSTVFRFGLVKAARGFRWMGAKRSKRTDENAVRKRSAAARLERQHKHSTSLYAEEPTVAVRSPPCARANSPSAASVYSARHLRSPSPQFGLPAARPSCCCAAAGRRPRTSFISASESTTSIGRRGGPPKTSVGGASTASRKSSTTSGRLVAKRSGGYATAASMGVGGGAQRKTSAALSVRSRLGSTATGHAARPPACSSAKNSSTSTGGAARAAAAVHYASASAHASPQLRSRSHHHSHSVSPRAKRKEDYVPVENYSDATHSMSIVAAIAASVASPAMSAASSPSTARRKVAAPLVQPPLFFQMEAMEATRKTSHHRHVHQQHSSGGRSRKNSHSSRHGGGMRKCHKLKYHRSKHQQPIIAGGNSTVDYVEVHVPSSQFDHKGGRSSKSRRLRKEPTEEEEFGRREEFSEDEWSSESDDE
ncbi:Insulin receptor substrate 1 [Aphelenchoides fujianensis]|nr:Insulin receptor substrate 1 [Aphelenchoides fujianensis]